MHVKYMETVTEYIRTTPVFINNIITIHASIMTIYKITKAIF